MGERGGLGEEELDLILQALAHPARRRVIEALAEAGALSYTELMQAAGVSDSGTFGFHMRRLKGLVEKDEEGNYRLTELGVKAHRVLQVLRGAEAAEPKPQARAPAAGGLVAADTMLSFELTEDYLRRLREKGKKLRIDTVGVLVIHPVDPRLFDEAVEAIDTVGVIHAPQQLRGLLEEKADTVGLIKYYDPEKGVPRPRLGETLSSLIRATGRAAALLASRLRGPRARGSTAGEARLGDGSIELDLGGCSATLEADEEAGRLAYTYSYEARDPGLSVEETERGVRIVCRPEGAERAELRVRVPANKPLRLRITADAAAVALAGLGVEELDASLDASVIRGDAALTGNSPQARLRLDASNASLKLSGDWVGEAVIRVDADASNAHLALMLPPDAKLMLSPEYLDAAAVAAALNGEKIPPTYAEEGYGEARRRIRIAYSLDASRLRVEVERRGTAAAR